MIKRLKLNNFKCFKESEFEFKNLNLFTGINSAGKSSVIQSILLIKQNFESFSFLKKIIKIATEKDKNMIYELFKKTKINDKYVKLGLSSDVLNEKAEKDEILIELETFSGMLSMKLLANRENNNEMIANYNEIQNLDFLLEEDNFFYLSAERISPKSRYPYSKEEILKNKIGNKGEYAVHYLAEYYNENLKIESLKSDATDNFQFRENVSRWMGKISNGIDVTAEANDLKMETSLKYNYGGKSYLPQNIGFGVTYTLPIVVLLLKAKKGDIIIIENPETHLHPRAQSEIAKLCCKVASEGVQLILETHSDHFLNAVRVAIKEKIISSDNSQIYFFNKDDENNDIIIENIKVNSEGKIEKWPKGFFDEWDLQLEKLLW